MCTIARMLTDDIGTCGRTTVREVRRDGVAAVLARVISNAKNWLRAEVLPCCQRRQRCRRYRCKLGTTWLRTTRTHHLQQDPRLVAAQVHAQIRLRAEPGLERRSTASGCLIVSELKLRLW